jgi:protein CWC15
MTTAHRPTWKPAVGRANQGGWNAGGAVSTSVSALEAPGQLSLKHLRKPVDKKKALRESLLALEKAEAKAVPKRKIDPAFEARAQQRLLEQPEDQDVDVQAITAKYDDSDVDDGGGGSGDEGTANKNHVPKQQDEDDTDLDESDSDLDDDDSSDDEDDEAALQAELVKIRQEREEARRKAQEEEEAEQQQKDESAALLGNPLLAVGADAVGKTTKRRWNEDVVFRNQAKGEPKAQKRFINDTVRNDFVSLLNAPGSISAFTTMPYWIMTHILSHSFPFP